MSQFETGTSDDHKNEASETRGARNMDELRVKKSEERRSVETELF